MERAGGIIAIFERPLRAGLLGERQEFEISQWRLGQQHDSEQHRDPPWCGVARVQSRGDGLVVSEPLHVSSASWYF